MGLTGCISASSCSGLRLDTVTYIYEPGAGATQGNEVPEMIKRYAPLREARGGGHNFI